MAVKKKSAPRKNRTNVRRSSARSRTGTASASARKRAFRAFGVSVVAAFGVASYFFNPHWQDGEALGSLLADLAGWQQPQPMAPRAVAAHGYAQTRFDQCPQFFPAQLPPVVPAAGALRELCFSAFAILHDGQSKTPVFVAQKLNRQMLMRARSVERSDRFYAEARLPQAERAELADYRGSNYSRGHMAPAADMHSDAAMAQSFSLANMVPQNQTHNAGAWSGIEQDTRKYVMRARGDVYIFTGPVYGQSPTTIGAGRVAVPSYLYKVVYDAGSGRSWVHWQANSPGSQKGTPISYDEFVRRTGLRLLPVAEQ